MFNIIDNVNSPALLEFQILSEQTHRKMTLNSSSASFSVFDHKISC